jgi:type IV secretory pathway TraG/TraD family ATPase VirD4
VRPYRSEAALSASEPPFFDADAFVRSSNTLYIAAPGSDQAMVAPMVVALLSEIREAAYRAHDEGALAHPVLFALDELAHIAPLPDLPSLVAEGGGQGVLTLGCLQDLSQARRRWGEEGAAFPSLFSTTLVLPGIADTKTLRLLAMLAGEERVLEQSVSFTSAKHGDSSSRTQSAHLRSRLAPDEIGRGRPGKALVVDSHNQMGWVQLTPAHKSRPFSTALERVRITKERESWTRSR